MLRFQQVYSKYILFYNQGLTVFSCRGLVNGANSKIAPSHSIGYFPSKTTRSVIERLRSRFYFGTDEDSLSLIAKYDSLSFQLLLKELTYLFTFTAAGAVSYGSR